MYIITDTMLFLWEDTRQQRNLGFTNSQIALLLKRTAKFPLPAIGTELGPNFLPLRLKGSFAL